MQSCHFVRTHGRYGWGSYESCIFHVECMESMGNRSNRFNTDYFNCYAAMPYKEIKDTLSEMEG